MTILDINSRSANQLERNLSNLALNSFTFDGYECSSLEGPLQALKTSHMETQVRICAMDPATTHRIYKKTFDAQWKPSQNLYWQGVVFSRSSVTHHEFITRLFDSAFEQSESFRNSLEEALGYDLQHSIGKYSQQLTVLTVQEFLGQLYRLQTSFAW